MTTTAKWTDERTQQLQALVGSESPVSAKTVERAAEELETTTRSIAAKLRKLGHEVASLAKANQPAFTADEAAALQTFVNSNAGSYTYAEIAANFMNGKFNAKQIQGKVLSLELTSKVKPSEKIEVPRSYTEAEEAKFLSLVNAGTFVEDIAAALNKTINSVRGKALSLLRSGEIEKIPAMKESHAKDKDDVFATLTDITSKTVAEIAAATGKTERGVRTVLTRRGIDCADYQGAARKAKAEAKAAA